ncbi:DUF998 domain-containing protein [Plantactinospora endophytica]|uniref:DUF998 domain-containing protein n=1 Tax=Plantactinospora endophytica TaxID=673535 RepID=A0ABQ4EF83_9ACTN|nr:DUF998 domain-containing protein [Plantactinospora endophytica]GIG93387.1 hypothetical protein Pen02_83230 [Plantactinospora endophytica]
MTGTATTPAGTPSRGVVGSTRTLLTCGVLAGPLYIVVVLLQMSTRDGFDITRHPASLLSNGTLGWIQIANFAVSGLLLVAYAIGLRRVLGPAAGRGGVWGPRLVGVFGAGMVAAAVFSADPADGFPPGTPPGLPTSVTWSGMLHFLVAGIAFLAVVAACFVFARRFARAGRRGWAVFSTATGALFLAGWMSIFALAGARPANVAFAVAIGLVLVWTSLTAGRRLRRPGEE